MPQRDQRSDSAPRSEPPVPNLQWCRKAAKKMLLELRRQDPAARLADAQLLVARQHGFASWRKLRAHLHSTRKDMAGSTTAAARPELVDEFIIAATVDPEHDHRQGSLHRAHELLDEHPWIGDANLLAACVLGRAERVGQLLRDDRSLATAAGGPRGWTPLLYLCFSRYLRLSRDRSGDFVDAARLLLDAGADPNSFFEARAGTHIERETALYGACGVANDPNLTALLLDRGAIPTNPPDNESLYHATEFADHACLRLLLERIPPSSWLNYCMCHMMDREDPAGLRLFLDHAADVNWLIDRGQPRGWRPLHFAIDRNRSATIIGMLLDAGADPNLPDANGVTPYELATRLGDAQAASLLLDRGASGVLTPTEAILAAIVSGDEARARRLLGDNVKGFVDSLSPQQRQALPRAAANGNLQAVMLMLDLGFDIDTKGSWGGSAIHQAAWNGHVEIVRLLIARGARLDLKQDFGGDALSTAIHGAGHAGHDNGPAIVELIARAMPAGDLSL
ncbi:ankyrin repeat domain-containing protein [Fontivita pretiosa]|uniref:ankyrin repeat domain-containing protein n=1 Tax=Fontivita pretiosa TaxID=2989684 RepID=UPI003D16B298